MRLTPVQMIIQRQIQSSIILRDILKASFISNGDYDISKASEYLDLLDMQFTFLRSILILNIESTFDLIISNDLNVNEMVEFIGTFVCIEQTEEVIKTFKKVVRLKDKLPKEVHYIIEVMERDVEDYEGKIKRGAETERLKYESMVND